MKLRIAITIGLIALAFHGLASGQKPVPPGATKPATPTKEMAAKNSGLTGNFKKFGPDPTSVGGPAKSTKGTAVIVGSAVARKH
jgi:hypothetical protein